jgi:adenylate cyclase
MGGGARRLNWWAFAYIVLSAGAALVLTTLLHFPHGPEHWSADLRTAYLSERAATQHDRIVLVYVSEKTLEKYPYVSPTDRQLLADLLRAVDAADPKAIGFDFIIDRPTEPAKDAELAEAVARVRAPLVLGAIDEPAVPAGAKSFQSSFLANAKRDVGHLYFDERHNMLIVSDRVIRLTAERNPGQPHRRSFAEIIAEKEGPFAQPQSRYIAWLLSPKDGTETFLTLSAEQALGRAVAQLPVRDLLQGKLVLIGGNFVDRDRHLTPLSVSSDTRYPGLFIHAQILAQLLANRSLMTLPWPIRLLAMIFAGWVGYVLGRLIGKDYLIIELVGVVVLIAAGIFAFSYAKIIFPYTGVLLAWIAGIAGGRYSRRVFPKAAATSG